MKNAALPSSKGPSAGSFVDSRFTASPEGQLLLNYLQNKFGVPIEVQKGNTDSGGYFDSRGGDSGYGGSLDKDRRVVYLNADSPDVHVLAHEAAHAYDPSLPNMHASEGVLLERSNPIAGFTYRQGVEPQMASDFLNAFMYASPAHTRLTSEALAQKEANESLKAIGVANPGLEDTWYRNYPKEHVEATIDKAYALMANPYTPSTSARDEYIHRTFDTPTMYAPPSIPSARNLEDSTQWDMRDAVAQNYLKLGLNPDLSEAARKVQARAEAYLDRMLPEAKKSEYNF